VQVTLPTNQAFIDEFGPYRQRLDVGDPNATAVTRKLRRAGLAAFEPATQATLLALAQGADDGDGVVEFFDVGSHIGLYSMLLTAILPDGHVRATAFEPTPATGDLLAALVDRNDLPVELVRRAVADEEGTATLYMSDKAETSNSLAEGFRESSASVEVATTTIDAYCRESGRSPDVIKIDVETFEAKVLRGASASLRDNRPSVVCELLPAAHEDDSLEVLSELEALSYHLFRWSASSGEWAPRTAHDVLEKLGAGRKGNYLFIPEPISDKFRRVIATWMPAIAACDAATNL